MGRGASRTGPTNFKQPTLAPVKEVAAGLPAVVSAWKHGIGKMGPLDSAKTLSRANQHKGFDCPGCAWPDPSEPSPGVALGESIGIGKGTVRLEDFDHSDLIVVVGQNPGTNHPRMLSALSSAKKSGSSVLSINPIRETGMRGFRHPQNAIDMLGSGVKIADDHVDIRINGDMALFRGIGSVMIENGWIDKSFIDSCTSGYDSYVKASKKIDWGEIGRPHRQARSRCMPCEGTF